MIYTAAVLSNDGRLFTALQVVADDFNQAADRSLAAAAYDAGCYHADGVPDTSDLRILALLEGEVPLDGLLRLIDT